MGTYKIIPWKKCMASFNWFNASKLFPDDFKLF